MNDFFDDTKLTEALSETQETTQETPETPKVKVGEEEYTQDELSQLVGLGKIGRELETKWNTKIDRVYPEFTKSQAELKELKTKLQSQPVQPQVSEDDAIRQAKEAARKIGIVTQEDFADFMGKNFRQFYVTERAAERLSEECDQLAEDINGQDGRPAFKKEEILNHMLETGLKNPEKAYKDKYEKELDAWKETQLNMHKTPGLYTQTTGGAGAKVPTEVKPTRDNLDTLIREALGQE